MRRDQSGRDAADHAAERDPHVERGQVPRRGPAAGELAVAHQRAYEQQQQMQHDQSDGRGDRQREKQHDQNEHHDRLRRDDEPVRNKRARLERDDEGQQIERERRDPEQRHGCDVGRDMRRHGDQEAGRHGRERDPDDRIARTRRDCFRNARRNGIRQSVGRAQQEPATQREQQDQDVEPRGPAECLAAERHERLDYEWIGDQRQKASDIARRIEEIRVLRGRMIGADEPRLDQRPVGGEREKRQPDRHGEQAEQPQRLAGSRRSAPPARDMQRQREARDDHHRQMNDYRHAPRREARQRMRVGVAGEQRGLEEHHRDRPHGRSAPKPGQHHLGEHRLHGEQQRRAHEDRRHIGEQQVARRNRAWSCVGRDAGCAHTVSIIQGLRHAEGRPTGRPSHDSIAAGSVRR